MDHCEILTQHFDVAASKCGMTAVFAKGSMVCSCHSETKIDQAVNFHQTLNL